MRNRGRPVEDRVERILSRNPLHGRWVHIVRQEAPLGRRRIPPEQIEDNGDKNVGCVVQNKGGSLIGLSQMRGEHSRRERNDDHIQQEEQIQNEKHVIGTGNVLKKPVVPSEKPSMRPVSAVTGNCARARCASSVLFLFPLQTSALLSGHQPWPQCACAIFLDVNIINIRYSATGRSLEQR